MIRYGVIAEDDTDGRTIKTVIHRRCGLGTSVKIRAGNGCAQPRVKAGRWLRQFALEQVQRVIVLHDLDRSNENELRRRLEAIDTPVGVDRLICIPVEEIEAWFWADPNVVQTVGRGTGKAHPNPHLIPSPKEALQRLSIGANSKPRYSTENNPGLAEILDLDLCASRCPSFRHLLQFLNDGR